MDDLKKQHKLKRGVMRTKIQRRPSRAGARMPVMECGDSSPLRAGIFICPVAAAVLPLPSRFVSGVVVMAPLPLMGAGQ
jgi:hypothetical protein